MDAEPLRTGLAQSLLREIAEHLASLADSGQAAAIDLLSLPMTEADRAELERALGHGEVAAALDAAGTSEVWETAYAGVWWIRHFGSGEKIAAERIEITTVPEILLTHCDNIRGAAKRLAADLADQRAEESVTHV